MSLKQKNVVIVGGSSGMGLAIAQSALAKGAQVTLVARSEERLKRANSTLDNRAVTISADFTDAAWGAFKDLTRERLLSAFNGKFFGYFQSIQAALPKLKKEGSILFLTGAASRVGMPGTAGLAAVNGAITQMAQTLSKELAPIRVNVISPGLVDTPAYDPMPEEARREMYSSAAQKLPVGRIGNAEDISLAAIMLLKNGFATGVILDIDGGIRS
jgi:NAD(P)-dependent dehydrogenase (short-subunit alcohol dehydrogenase family)